MDVSTAMSNHCPEEVTRREVAASEGLSRPARLESIASDIATETIRMGVVTATPSWTLEVQDDAGARAFRLGSRPVVVGSSRSADIPLHDRTVSARHCEVYADGEGILVRDLDSRNGTFVGGARIRQAIAQPGTVVTLGQSTFVCSPGACEDEEEVGPPLPGVAGCSQAMQRLAAQVRQLAKLRAPVLIAGETGVGKELVARALHTEGPRASSPFVPLNVAALPRELVESELFGHERGAFTGAVARRNGVFAEADGGTLFLDEIGELPIDAQPKLLRALDGYEVRRVGAAGSGVRSNVRLVAATHVRLEDHVAQGAFRRDLFHRLEVFVIEVPPLRARPGDIVAICRLLLSQLEPDVGKRELSSSAIAALTAHAWPGNVRELRNVLLRSAYLARERWLDAASVQRAMRREGNVAQVSVSRDVASELLRAAGGNMSAAARAAGLPRTTFRKLIAAPS